MGRYDNHYTWGLILPARAARPCYTWLLVRVVGSAWTGVLREDRCPVQKTGCVSALHSMESSFNYKLILL